jgi:hypothetical protein
MHILYMTVHYEFDVKLCAWITNFPYKMLYVKQVVINSECTIYVTWLLFCDIKLIFNVSGFTRETAPGLRGAEEDHEVRGGEADEEEAGGGTEEEGDG